MFKVVCAHTRVWGCGAMLACAVRPPHYTEPHHTVLHPITPHLTTPCRRALLAGRAEELLAALVFLPSGGAGRWRALCSAECKPSAAMGLWTACCHFAGERRGAGSPAAVEARWAVGGLPAAAARSVLQAQLFWELGLVNI